VASRLQPQRFPGAQRPGSSHELRAVPHLIDGWTQTVRYHRTPPAEVCKNVKAGLIVGTLAIELPRARKRVTACWQNGRTRRRRAACTVSAAAAGFSAVL
jgi:hypothetical protein